MVAGLLLLFAASACGVEGNGLGDEAIGHSEQAATVESYVDSACATSVVLPLSIQIADEVMCMAPGSLSSFSEGNGIVFSGSAVVPYLADEAKTALLDAVAANGGSIQITSAYRTVAQQYLLYRWAQQGRCGITVAATPGSSNHESGRALDVSNYSSWIGPLGARGWTHNIPNDPWHFDHPASPSMMGMDVHAFQRLWNRNNPGDLIDEDGAYGPQTAARLAASPAGGFAIGACTSGESAFDAEYVGAEIPTALEPGERQVAWIELRNTGTATWTVQSTRLGTTAPKDRDSLFYDAENWLAPHRPTSVDQDTPPGTIGRFTFMVNGPVIGDTTLVRETFGLVEEGTAWFGPEDLTLEIEVRGNGEPDPPDDPDDPGEPDGQDPDDDRDDDPVDPGQPGADDALSGHGDLLGGCAASGTRSGPDAPGAGLLFLLALALVARRRR